MTASTHPQNCKASTMTIDPCARKAKPCSACHLKQINSEGTASAQRIIRAPLTSTALPACGVNGNCYRQTTCGDHYCPGHPVNNPPTKPARHHTEPVAEIDYALRARFWRWYITGWAVFIGVVVLAWVAWGGQ